MATAQVLANPTAPSRKGHLEAGKKKLEEFRKKKAEGRAKKVTPTSQLPFVGADENDKFAHFNGHTRDGACTEDINIIEVSGSVIHSEEKAKNSPTTNIGSSSEEHANLSDYLQQETGGHLQSKLSLGPGFPEPATSCYENGRKSNSDASKNGQHISEETDYSATENLVPFNQGHTIVSPKTNRNHSSSYSFDDVLPKKISDIYSDTASIAQLTTSVSEDSENGFQRYRPGITSTLANPSTSHGSIMQHPPTNLNHGNSRHFDLSERRISDITSRHLSIEKVPGQIPELSSSKSSFDRQPFTYSGYGTDSGQQHQSFLDSLGLSRASLKSNVGIYLPQSTTLQRFANDSNVPSTKILPSFIQQSAGLAASEEFSKLKISDANGDVGLPLKSSDSLNDEHSLMQPASDSYAQDLDMLATIKKDEEFSSLEQHIQDLTQEKFSLQRAVDKSRTLAESLASENSFLTESFNQQGKVVSQLKSEMERLQEEIKAQLLVLDTVKMEYTNSQLECSAADERARILASEVIGLEEKALRLRSNELKLEKQLELVNMEVASYKRKASSFEKERQDFHLTIDSLQEEKKLLQSKLRKASAYEKVMDDKGLSTKSDASTSTDDLGELANIVRVPNVPDAVTVDLFDRQASRMQSNSASTSSLLNDDRGFGLSAASMDIPQEQRRMIENISSLISELAIEKEELLQVLKTESASVTKLKGLNKDLSQKLEVQTQRLELLTAQRMANVTLPTPVETHSMHPTVEYADEGDVVVETVLGWIMKLFPGGGSSSKRRASKRL